MAQVSISAGAEVKLTTGGQENLTTEAQENPMAAAFGNVTAVAQSLQDTVANLQANIANSANSAEEGTKMLNEMLEAARGVNESLDKDSEVWVDLNALLSEWSAKRDQTFAAAQDNPAMKKVADLWAERVEQGMALRTQILDQASSSSILVADIEAQREVVLAFFEVGAADAVLASMQQISDQLGEMNAEMQSILATAGVDVPTPVSQ
jgi:uncharacterized protein YyaL (SSP411 family)